MAELYAFGVCRNCRMRRGTMSDSDGKVIGKVKWFNDQKGYGFIAREDSTDVFVHHTQIQMEGFRTLREGDDVLYELRDGPKGPQAVNVNKYTENA
jgi:cold shock protein